MSMSDDNTNELDSYGVWVKNSADTNENANQNQEELKDINTESAFDLPDFNDTDFSDMFKDDSQFTTDEIKEESFSDDNDSTLSTDELANITGMDNVSIEQVEAPADESEKTEIDINTDLSSDNGSDGAMEEINLEDFDISGDMNTTEAEGTESSAATDEVSFGGEEEISLDDFMDSGFSDESVASGNNGFEPGKEPAVSSETEELSLDDFMGDSSFDMAPPEAKAAEEVVEDEPPLEMDLNFDDSADSIQTEENVSIESDSGEEEDFDEEAAPETETEEVSLDDFTTSFTESEKDEAPAPGSSSDNLNTEDVDLSDFGIDANAEETPIVQDVEEAKNKEVVVDYDLSVGDENTSAAPVVNEINNSEAEKSETIEEAKVPENSTVVQNSLLEQIVADLSGLKNEINRLKENIEEIKASESKPTPVVENTAEINEEPEIEIKEEKDEGGFFSSDDGDDTIALSFDELDNIMNNAEFSDTIEASQQNADEETIADEPVTEETVIEEPVITDEPVFEETAIEEPIIAEEPIFEETAIEEPVIADEPVAEETAIEEPVIADEPVFEETAIEEPVIADEPVAEETVIEEPVIADEPVIEETVIEEPTLVEEPVIENEPVAEETFESTTPTEEITFDEETPSDNDLSFEFEDEKLEEPVIDDFSIEEENLEETSNEDLPEEISISKDDDMFVESTTSDFMDSVKDVSENEEKPAEDFEDLSSDIPSELPEEVSFEQTEDSTTEPEINFEENKETENEEIPTVDKILESTNDEEPIFDKEEPSEDEISFEDIPEETTEPVIEETTEPVIEETSVSFEETQPEPEENTFDEVDNLDNNLSESNIEYITSKDDEKTTETEAVTMNSDLKQDIKSVLLYMDQLLENLPEDKIVEFAKSDEFTTYKKLFSELGLS